MVSSLLMEFAWYGERRSAFADAPVVADILRFRGQYMTSGSQCIDIGGEPQR